MSHRDYIAPLVVGQRYDRPTLAALWGLGGFQAISRGVFTPAGTNRLFLFVTREKQACLTQYRDFLDGDLLFWEGEKGHGSDARIRRASVNGEEIHLFYRERHHSPFVYHGPVLLARSLMHTDRPSEFVCKVVARGYAIPAVEPALVAEPEADYQVASAAVLSAMDKQTLAKTRGLAQHIFRGNLLKMWDGACAVTGVREARILRAGHIKPWRDCTVAEKLDGHNGLLLVPDLDALFEEGLITFDEDGAMLTSDDLARDDRDRLRISDEFRLRRLVPDMQPYLEYHRDRRFIA